MEFLETEKYSIDNYPKSMFDSFNEKYNDIKPDLLICREEILLKPLKDFGESYLLNLPTITLDFDYKKYGYPTSLNFNTKTVQVGLNFNIEKSISTALNFFPQTSSIYFISGTSSFDIGPEATYKVSKGNYEKLFGEARNKVRAWEKENIK